MRERFVSVAIPREPAPPAFRVPEKKPVSDSETMDAMPSITDVSGIGPVYATRLGEIGVNTPSELAKAEAETIADAAQVPLSRAEGWISAARSLATGA